MQGFITAVANPKGWAFFIAMVPAFINYEANLIPQMSALVIIILIIEFISLMIYATGGQALGIMLKYKLINEAGMSAYLAKYIRRDNTPRVIQLPKPREATAALEKTLIDVVNRQGNQAFTVSEITQKVEAMVGKTTDSACLLYTSPSPRDS